MLHFGTHKTYDDDDEDDDIYGIEDDDHCDRETNTSINNKTNKIMNRWLKRNWFITLRTRKEMRHISFINIIEVNTEAEGEKHFLNIVTSIGTYKCGMPKKQCVMYTSMFHEGDLEKYDLRNVVCDSVEFKSN